MGLFDYIKCKYPLPDGFVDHELHYQTKDTAEPYLFMYTITEEGKLIQNTSWCQPKEDTKEDKEVPFHGALRFCATNLSGKGPKGYYTDDGEHGWWREYTALFDRGKLLKIEGGIRLEDKPPITQEGFWDELNTGCT